MSNNKDKVVYTFTSDMPWTLVDMFVSFIIGVLVGIGMQKIKNDKFRYTSYIITYLILFATFSYTFYMLTPQKISKKAKRSRIRKLMYTCITSFFLLVGISIIHYSA